MKDKLGSEASGEDETGKGLERKIIFFAYTIDLFETAISLIFE